MPVKETLCPEAGIELADVIIASDDACPAQELVFDGTLEESGEGVREDSLYPCATITFINAVKRGEAKDQEWGMTDVAATSMLWLFCVAFFGFVLSRDGEEEKLFTLFLVFVSATWVVLAGWPLLASYYKGNGAVIDFGLTWRCSDIGWGLAYVPLLVVVLLLVMFVLALLRIHWGIDPFPYIRFSSFFSFELYFLIFWPVDVVVKQIFCNGLVFTAVAKALHRMACPLHEVIAVAASSFAFACVHMDIAGFLIWISVGVVFACARYHTASLTPAIVAHMTVFLIFVLMILFAMSFG